MTAIPRKAPEPPLGVIGALASGFEAVNARPTLILLPLLLDLFLWLGPHLSIQPLVQDFLSRLPPAGDLDPQSAQSLSLLYGMLAGFGARFNLFAMLSTAPLGLPSLVAGRAPLGVPGGLAQTWPVADALVYLLLAGVLLLAGLFLAALYFGLVAQQVRDARLDLRRLQRQVWADWARLTALAVILLLVLAGLGGPLFLFSGITSLLSPLAGGLVSLIGGGLLALAVSYLSFAVHGVTLQRRGLLSALWDSIRLVHASLPQTASLYLVVVVLYGGLGALWNLPADDSWLLLVGVAGHALVATALVAATFVFYRERYRWWMEARQAAVRQAAAAGPRR